MRGVRMLPDQDPEIIEFEGSQKALEELVSGHPEIRTLPGGYGIISNMDSRLEQDRPNCIIAGELFMGPVLITGLANDGLSVLADLPAGEDARWADSLLEARERALPLIREWDRGI